MGRGDRFKISDPSGAILYNLTNKSLISVVTSPKFSSFLDLPKMIAVGSSLSNNGEARLIASCLCYSYSEYLRKQTISMKSNNLVLNVQFSALCVRQCNYKKSKFPKSKTLLRLNFSSEIIQTFFK